MEELFEAIRSGELDEVKNIIKVKGVSPEVVNKVNLNAGSRPS